MSEAIIMPTVVSVTLGDVHTTINDARNIRDRLATALKSATEMRDQWQATIDALNEQIGTPKRKRGPGRPRGSKKKVAEAGA